MYRLPDLPLLAHLPVWAQALVGLTVLVAAAAFANAVVKRMILIERLLRPRGYESGSVNLDPIARLLADVARTIVIAAGLVAVIGNVARASIMLSILLAISAALTVITAIYRRRPHAVILPTFDLRLFHNPGGSNLRPGIAPHTVAANGRAYAEQPV